MVRPHLVLKVNLPPAASLQMSDWLQADPVFGGNSLSVGSVVDVGFGGIRLLCWGSSGGTAEDIRRLRKSAGKLGGSVVVEQCPLALKRELDVWGELTSGTDAGTDVGMEIMRRLKNKFDPHRTLNPGRFLGGL